MPGGAPFGNQNAVKSRRWSQAIDQALAKRSKGEAQLALVELAEKLLQRCDEGDLSAIKELGDRVEGKAVQPISGPDGDTAVLQTIERRIVDPKSA